MAELEITETVTLGDAGPAVPELAPGEILAGRFEIQNVLGRGGYAVVYRARDRELGRDVAVKLLRPDRLSPASLLRLRREVNVARDVASDRLVRIFDIATADGSVFLTMELVEGGSLEQRLTQRGPLPVDEAIRIASQILEGLAVLHAHSIIHRDVKPANVLLTPAGDVKLADFGLALALSADETRATRHDAVIGTLQYLSPEQVLGQEVDARSDLYSLGVVLFEMLTGRRPYEGRSALGAMLGHLRDTPDVGAARRDVPRWLDAVVARLLERRPEDRYPSAEAVLAALAARSAPRLRLPGWLVATVAAVLLLVGVAALIVWNRPEETRFSYLKFSKRDQTATAIDREGKPLWTLPKVLAGTVIPAQLARNEPFRIVGVFDAYQRTETSNQLSILDADTKNEISTIELDGAAKRFAGFSDTFIPALYAVDLDGDGGEEILAVYVHRPWWPSFAVLYEPDIDRQRIVFLASGHHHFKGAQDLDGDGKPELLFAGINNRMGWYTGIAAVRLVPPVNDPSPWTGPAGGSPDATYEGAYPAALLWYCLGPQDDRLTEDLATFDAARKTILLRYTTKSVVVGFDGFSPQQPATPNRPAARDAAYEQLRESERLLRLGFFDAAFAALEAASENAAKIRDPFLADWAARVHARSLVAAGRLVQAEEAYQKLMRSSEAATEAAFEAGKAYHLAGHLNRAVEWYLRGFGPGGSNKRGRGKWEPLEGAVLALAEMGRYRAAQERIDDFAAAYEGDDLADRWRRFVLWREGASPGWPDLNFEPLHDLHRYWALEILLRSGSDPRSLLAQVDRALILSSEADPMLLSLKAELLARSGRNNEAARVSEDGYERAKQQRRELTGVRAHMKLIAERAARFTRAVGNETRAREIEAELAQWLETRG